VIRDTRRSSPSSSPSLKWLVRTVYAEAMSPLQHRWREDDWRATISNKNG
jgi:hypothetical protein